MPQEIDADLSSVFTLAISDQSPAKIDDQKSQDEKSLLSTRVPHPSQSPKVIDAQISAWLRYYDTHGLHGDNLRKKIFHRYRLGWAIFSVLIVWVVFVGTVLVLAGLKMLALGEALLGGLLASSVLNVFGFTLVVQC